MIKVVLDTNVIISGVIMDRGTTYQIIKKWENGEFEVVSSELILQEIQRVLCYPHIKNRKNLTEKRIESILNTLRAYAIITPARSEISVILEDPKDDMFIVAAIEGDAEYIVSGDHHLLDIESFMGAKIISPSVFLQILNSRNASEA
jgi:hypothetical protein